MRPVIRRILVLVFAVFVLAGCGAAERDALSVGDRSISEEGLTDLVLAVNGGAPDGETPAAIDLEVMRNVGSVWLSDAAVVSYLASTGVTLTDAERDSIKVQIEDAISSQQIAPISRESEGFEALTNNIWVASQPANLGTPEAEQDLLAIARDADVESRLGMWDNDTQQIVPRG
jgi:hypothetical protein